MDSQIRAICNAAVSQRLSAETVLLNQARTATMVIPSMATVAAVRVKSSPVQQHAIIMRSVNLALVKISVTVRVIAL